MIIINGEMYIALNIFLELNNDFIGHTRTKILTSTFVNTAIFTKQRSRIALF